MDAVILKVPQHDGNDDDDEEEEDDVESEINSELDDDDDEEQKTDHLILCQYEKVSRIKNKWKCILRDGVVHMNGRDYVFNRVFFFDRRMAILSGNICFAMCGFCCVVLVVHNCLEFVCW